MTNRNIAKDILWPKADNGILVRVVFLYVGQGSSTIVLVADGDTYKSVLIDINLDSANGGIDVPKLMADILEEDGLDVFVNTHPHDDHLRGINELSDKVTIGEVWHSGHRPSKKHGDCHKDLKKLIDKVTKAGGAEVILKGSSDERKIGEAQYYVLAPAEYLTDDVNEEEAEERYNRIHEQCAVLKFGTDNTWIMVPGDADRDAFEKYIAEYHKERLGAVTLAASHHGSRSFFKHDEDEDPYLDALKEIAPTYVVISAPKTKESQHDHPHKDAVDIYSDQCGRDNVLHTGEKRYCYICDIYRDGSSSGIDNDNGDLAEEYSLDSNNKKGGKEESSMGPAVRIDDRPMGRR